jgi:hypothetical protein
MILCVISVIVKARPHHNYNIKWISEGIGGEKSGTISNKMWNYRNLKLKATSYREVLEQIHEKRRNMKKLSLWKEKEEEEENKNEDEEKNHRGKKVREIEEEEDEEKEGDEEEEEEEEEEKEEEISFFQSERNEIKLAKWLSLKEHKANKSTHFQQRNRLKSRIELYNLTEKKIAADGACMFRSISDQLFGTPIKHLEVRSVCVDWLQQNRSYSIFSNNDSSSQLWQFAACENEAGWDAYCQSLRKSDTWGDHLCLIAATEVYHMQISILSSVEGLLCYFVVFVKHAMNVH